MRLLENKKKRIVSPKEKVQVSQYPDFLDFMSMMKECVEEANASLWQKVEHKISSYEAKVEKLEGAIFERDQKIDKLEADLSKCQESMQRCEEHLNEMERHSRAANLVLTSQRFGRRREREDIAELTICVINESYTDIHVTKNDFSVIHRLPKDNTVICAFKNQELRNKIYEDRLRMRHQANFSQRLFVNENLTKANSAIFKGLLELKKGGKLWTVFSKAGIPSCKIAKTSSPRRVHTAQQLAALERELSRLSAAPAAAAGRAGAAGPPASRPAPPTRPRSPPPARPGSSLGGGAGWRGTEPPLPRRRGAECGGGRPGVAGAEPADASSRRTGGGDVADWRGSPSVGPSPEESAAEGRVEPAVPTSSPPAEASTPTPSAHAPAGGAGLATSLSAVPDKSCTSTSLEAHMDSGGASIAGESVVGGDTV